MALKCMGKTGEAYIYFFFQIIKDYNQSTQYADSGLDQDPKAFLIETHPTVSLDANHLTYAGLFVLFSWNLSFMFHENKTKQKQKVPVR